MTPVPARARLFEQFWAAPHRPFFLAGFVWALLSIIWWPLLQAPVGLASPSLWHAHELLVGFGGAAIAGYLLTALPNWVGRDPLQGRPLQALFTPWVLGRFTTTFTTIPLLQIAMNSGFLLSLAMLTALPVLATRNFRRLGLVALVVGVGLGDVIFLATATSGDVWNGQIVARTGPFAFALLITTIASRAIPAFTLNALRQRGIPLADTALGSRCWRPVQALLLGALMCMAFDISLISGALLMLSAVLMIEGMRHWQTRQILTDPLLLMLHLNFAWVPAGCGVVALALMGVITYPVVDALHILTIGAMSGLVMAISGRAAARLANGLLRVGPWFPTAFALLSAALFTRLLAPIVPDQYPSLITLSGLLWCLSWTVFILGFRTALIGPPRRPVLSGRKADPVHIQQSKV